MLQIVHYPHPTLSYESKTLVRVDAQLKRYVDEMFELMYEHRGVGLAANQVDLPLRMFVINESGQKGMGEERVFINPTISQPKASDEAEEGCLSLPGVYAPVRRPKQIHIQAYDMTGNEINETVDGFLARVLQHEYDHLAGVMFIDRISDDFRLEVEEKIDEVVVQFNEERRDGIVGADEEIASARKVLEQRYC
jgi:peptide deformylase